MKIPALILPVTSSMILFAACATSHGTSQNSGSASTTGYTGLGADSVSAQEIAEFAPPALPPDVARRIQVMFDVRAPGIGMVSPNGNQLFFTWAVTGTRQIWRLDSPKSFPIQVTGGEEQTSLSGITPDGKFLIVSRDRNGEENPGLYLQSVGGGALTEIQHKAKVQTFFEFVTDDSHTLFFRANDLQPDSFAIYKLDLQTMKKELVFNKPGIWGVADYKKDGRLLLGKATGSRSSEFFEWNPATNELRPLFGQNEKEEYDAAYSEKEGELLVLTPKFGDFKRLYRWEDNRDTEGKFTPVTPEMKMDVAGFTTDHLKKRLVYTTNQQGYTKLYAANIRDGRVLHQPEFVARFRGANHVVPGSFTLNGRYLPVGVETGKAPSTSFVYDWQTGKFTQWVVPSSPEVAVDKFSIQTLESYPAADGTPIPMFVRRPPQCADAATPCPVIVNFHGGPESQSVPAFSPVYQLFVDAGFIVVDPNVRGSAGYGKTWIDSDNGAKRLNVITDIRDCATYLRSHWTRNGKSPKVGIMGGSYGGYSTLIGMTMFAGSYDAGVAIVGMSNLVTFLKNTAPYRRILRTTEYGDPDTDLKALQQLSPMTYIDRTTAPLMVIQGANDPRVPVGEAIQIHRALQKRNIPGPLIIFPDEGHGAGKRSNRVLEFGHALEFFKKYLTSNGV